jgi:hypothetical protein
MKRAMSIASTVLITACINVPGPQRVPSLENAGTETTLKAETVTTTSSSAGANVYANSFSVTETETSQAAADPVLPTYNPGLLGFRWNSGQQQCEVGDNKIVYRFWQTRRELHFGFDEWEVHYEVSAEDRRRVGSGWRQVNQLAYIQYSLGFGVGAPLTGTLTQNVVRQSSARGILARGTNPNGFATVAIKVERFGGPHGIHVIWPGDGCHPS